MMEQTFAHDVFISFSFEDQLIADKIVNQLTNKYQIPCWICTAEIRGGDDFYTDIMEAITASKILVFVQTKNSVESKEIPDEIYSAIAEGKIIISFIVEDSELKGGMKLKLRSRQFVDARKPTLDERIEELAKELCMLLDRPFNEGNIISAPTASKEKLLSTPSVMPKTIFCGRDEVLNEIADGFQNGKRVLFLYGIGGIGKTQIAKQYAARYKGNYDTVIYATYNGSIKNLLISETPFALEPEMIRYTLSDGTKEDDDCFFKRKLEKIQKLSNERTLIILDNFDTESDADLSALMNGKYHLLITTRSDYSRSYPTLRIGAIDSIEHLKNIFLQNYKGYDVDENDPALIDLIELVNRHTYTIELLAQHMEISGQKPREMIDALKKEGILSLNNKVRSNMKTQIAYENLLKMFDLFILTEEERRVLMYLSLMPLEGVNVRDFRTWADLQSYEVIINLEMKSWIIRNTNGIALHPIIREVVKHKIPANEENCENFLQRFAKTIEESNSWRFKKSEKDKHEQIVISLLKNFPVINEKTELLYFNAQNLFSFNLNHQDANILAERLYQYYCEKCGPLSFEAGRSAFKAGWNYAYNCNVPNATEHALKWLHLAENILQNISFQSSNDRRHFTQTLVNLAKSYLALYSNTKNIKDYETAKNYAEMNVQMTTKYYHPEDYQYGKVAGAFWQLSDVLREKGLYEEALPYIEKAIAILSDRFAPVDISFASFRKAMILHGLGRSEEALLLAEKNVVIYMDCFGFLNPNIYIMYDFIGDCSISLNKIESARTAYNKALEIAQTIFSPDAKQIAQAKTKLQSLT